MDSTRFDTVSRLFGSGMTRREALRGLFAGAAAVAAGGAVLSVEDASAKRRRKKGKKGGTGGQTPTTGQPQLLPPGSRCESTAQCTTGYICEVPVNGSNSDRSCAGGPGASCGAPNGDGDDTAPFCAVGHRCVASGGGYICQAVPEE
jgi:hypothetical protein